MPAPRFIPKLRLALFLPTLVALLVGMPVVWVATRALLQEAAEGHLRRMVPLIDSSLAQAGELSATGLQSTVVDLATKGGIRITLIDEDGTVLADSDRDLAEVVAMDNHRSRPEVEGARTRGYGTSLRRSATLDREFFYLAARLERETRKAAFLRLAEPITASAVVRQRLVVWVLLSTLASLLAMAAVSFWLNRKLFSPLAQIRRDADRLARGDLGGRLEVPDAEEAAAIARVVNQLADRVETQIQSAEAERGHLRAVGESIADGIQVTDREGRVQTANLALRRLLRVRGEVEGRTVKNVTGSREIGAAVALALDSGDNQTLEVAFERPRARTLSVTCSLLQNRGGVVVTIRDITEFLLLGQIRRDLVANVSHELKTPLTAIRGYAETLVDGALDDPKDALHFTQRILQQCERLQALLADLLTLSRLEGGAQRETEAIDLAAVIEEAAEVLSKAAERKNVDLALEVEPTTLQGDREALCELCLNLIDNAIKYNKTGGKVTVRLSPGDSHVDLEVADTGHGIPDPAQPRIFERFYRVDRGRGRGEGGTGLGLAIVKHAVEQHHGRIDVESRLGEGSVFRIRFAASPVAPAMPHGEGETHGVGTGPRVR